VKSVAMLAFGLALGAEERLGPPPLGLDLLLRAPESNPMQRGKVELGRRLFFDKNLSRDGTLACAGCHDPKLAFSDGRVVARGIHGVDGTRNSPALINRGYGESFFWDGRAATLEAQAIEPILNPKELGLSLEELDQRTGKKASEVTAALAAYVRTIRSGDSPYDRYVAGQADALTDLEKRGMALFRGKARCNNCHSGPTFTDEQFHNTGITWRDGRLFDEGRFTVSGRTRDHGAFKTPSLREVARTAPYMHDGSLARLEDVIDFYSNGALANPYLDSEIRPLHLSAGEKRALLDFLRSLTGEIRQGWQ
jgi:cytochrome c peroxidase